MTSPAEPGAPPVDARVTRSRRRVLETTYELLTENGLSGVTVDDIARRSGVAKTTIYRHWPDRSSLLLEACSSLAPEPVPPDTGDLRTDLGSLLRSVRDELQKPWAAIYPSIIDAGERDPMVRSLQTLVLERYVAPFREVVRRARERGDAIADDHAERVIAALLGHLYYRRWFSREPLDDRAMEEADALVELLCPASAPDPDGPGGQRQ